MGIQDKPWLDLGQGEEVLWWNHPHLINYSADVSVGVVMVAAGAAMTFLIDIPKVDESWFPLLLSLFGILFIFWQFVRRGHHYYVITTQKIVEKRGILSENRDPIHFNRIANTQMNRSVGERVVSLMPFGPTIGDIRIETAGTDSAEMFMDNIPDATSVSQLVEDQMVQNGNANPATGGYGRQDQQGGHGTQQRDGFPDQGGRDSRQQGGYQGNRGPQNGDNQQQSRRDQ